MSSWREIELEAPEFAARVKAVFDSGTNKTLATVRRDGSPRISGTELVIADGRITLGMMPASKKRLDVERDNRVAIHSPTLEPPGNVADWVGDAKLAGLLLRVEGGFELDVHEVVLTSVPAGRLRIESWHTGRGLEVSER